MVRGELSLRIECPRLLLRGMESVDVDDVLAFRSNPEVARHLMEEPMGREGVETMVGKQVAIAGAVRELGAGWDGGAWLGLAVVLRESGRVIGEVGAYVGDRREERGRVAVADVAAIGVGTGEVGWIVHPAFQGRGLGGEAARGLVGFGFGGLGLRRITAGCDAGNVASVRMMERLGMRREAWMREARWARGEWVDTVAYGLLREEWVRERQGGQA